MQRTYSTALPTALPDGMDTLLERACALAGQARRAYYVARHVRGQPQTELKRQFQPRFGLNARWFNGLRFDVDAQVASAVESRKLQVDSLTTRIEKQKLKVARLTAPALANSRAVHRFRKASPRLDSPRRSVAKHNTPPTAS